MTSDTVLLINQTPKNYKFRLFLTFLFFSNMLALYILFKPDPERESGFEFERSFNRSFTFLNKTFEDLLNQRLGDRIRKFSNSLESFFHVDLLEYTKQNITIVKMLQHVKFQMMSPKFVFEHSDFKIQAKTNLKITSITKIIDFNDCEIDFSKYENYIIPIIEECKTKEVMIQFRDAGFRAIIVQDSLNSTYEIEGIVIVLVTDIVKRLITDKKVKIEVITTKKRYKTSNYIFTNNRSINSKSVYSAQIDVSKSLNNDLCNSFALLIEIIKQNKRSKIGTTEILFMSDLNTNIPKYKEWLHIETFSPNVELISSSSESKVKKLLEFEFKENKVQFSSQINKSQNKGLTILKSVNQKPHNTENVYKGVNSVLDATKKYIEKEIR